MAQLPEILCEKGCTQLVKGYCMMDFGNGIDLGNHVNEDTNGGCLNRQFNVLIPTNEILNKYGIDINQFMIIAKELQSNLSWGKCNWCS